MQGEVCDVGCVCVCVCVCGGGGGGGGLVLLTGMGNTHLQYIYYLVPYTDQGSQGSFGI